MPRAARIDSPGLLQHVIVRGIERRPIFLDDQDREDFLSRLAILLRETETGCYAWSLLDNHFHLLLKPQPFPLSSLMRRLLTGYAVTFNLRHNRSGHLFQNRYKSLVCDEDPYLLELIRYIHLNPLRSGMVKSLEMLKGYPWSGHRELLGISSRNLIRKEFVLAFFGATRRQARARYEEFVADGLKGRDEPKLTCGGKQASRALNPALAEDAVFDERVLGGGAFVEKLLPGPVASPGSREPAFLALISQVAPCFGLAAEDLRLPNKTPAVAQAKAVICHVATRCWRMKGMEVGKSLGLTPSAVSHASRRGGALWKNEKRLAAIRDQIEKPSL